MKNILVTGGCGFIGSNFIRHIIGRGYQIFNLDLLTYAGNPENLSDIEGRKEYKSLLKKDIGDSSYVSRILAEYKIDTVVNFAAESHVDRSILGPEIFTTTNILGTQKLLDVSRNYWTSLPEGYKGKRFLQISTDEVYGSLPKTGKFKETTPLAPNSPYSASKASADMMVRAYVHTYGFPGIISRCSNNYGPYQFPEKLIPLMIYKAMQDQHVPVYGKGLNIRDWLYVEDHCSAIEIILNKGKNGEIYNIGGNNEWKNIDVVKLILKLLKKPQSLIMFVKDRPGHDMRYAMDAGKISRELGWKPKHTFEKGIRETINWYINSAEWMRNVINKEYLNYYNKNYGKR